MAKYKLHLDIAGVGKAGDIVELQDIRPVPFNSYLQLMNENDPNDLEEMVEFERKQEMETLVAELNGKVGIGLQRARWIVGKYKTRAIMLNSTDHEGIEKVEDEAIMKYYNKQEERKDGISGHTIRKRKSGNDSRLNKD